MLVVTNTMHLATDTRIADARIRHHLQPRPYAGHMAERTRGGRRERKTPAELVTGWPDEVAADPVVETARRLAMNLRGALAGRSVRDAARAAEVDYTTVYAILNGTTWPDVMTLARLEAGLDADLWPVGVARSQANAGSTE